MNFDKQYSEYQKSFEQFLNAKIAFQETYIAGYYRSQLAGLALLKKHVDFKDTASEYYSDKLKNFLESLKYSLLGEGKRFRPVLCLAIADLLGKKHSLVLPLALAIEMIHTYSLIHDDLPCMDNDDLRRGKPTHHKVFGESTALLAGDALLTESFRVVSEHAEDPANTLKVIHLLTECAGSLGMIGGQYVDLSTQKNKVGVEALSQMQINKTGALIRAAIVGSSILCDATYEQMKALEEFAKYIGLNFQIADDILDHQKNELGSFVSVLGLDESKKLLHKLTNESLHVLEPFKNSEFLRDLSQFNSQRLK